MASESSLRTQVSLTLLAGVCASGALILAGLLSGHPGLLKAGVLTLIATPFLRVGVLGLGFAMARQWRLAGLCAGLFLLLLTVVLFGLRS